MIIFCSNRNSFGLIGNFDIYSVKPDGTKLTRLTDHEDRDYVPRPSPDGSKIAFKTYRSGERSWWIMNRDGSDKRVLLEDGWLSPFWLSDNSKLAYQLDDAIYVINADGSNAMNLTGELDAHVDMHQGWSPDSSKMVFSVGSFSNKDYYVVGVDGTGLMQLTGDSGFKLPQWSPDSNKIAFSQGANIYVVDADGSNMQKLTDSYGVSKPVWSPDSSKILYSYSSASPFNYLDPETSDLWVMNSDGSNKQKLTENESGNGQAVWTQDSSKIAYLSYDLDYTGDYISDIRYSSLIFMNSDGTDKTTVINKEERRIRDLEWSKDGERLICDNCYSMNADGGDMLTFSTMVVDDVELGFAGWSPDGRRIIWRESISRSMSAPYPPKNPDIFVMNTDGMINVTNDPDDIYEDSDFHWLPPYPQAPEFIPTLTP